MNNETITITRNGKTYEVDFKKAEELGVIKEKVEYPKSWEEFSGECDNSRKACRKCWWEVGTYKGEGEHYPILDEEKIAFESFGKLIQIRDWWWNNMCDGWRPNSEDNYIIMRTINDDGVGIIDTDESCGDSYTLSFPSEELRDKFLETYNDLINEAKMFL